MPVSISSLAMALDTSVNASPAFWMLDTALRGRDGQLAGRTCQISRRNMDMSSTNTYFGLCFRHGSQAIFVRLARGRRWDGRDGPWSEPELVRLEFETGAGKSLRNPGTLEGNPLSPRDGRDARRTFESVLTPVQFMEVNQLCSDEEINKRDKRGFANSVMRERRTQCSASATPTASQRNGAQPCFRHICKIVAGCDVDQAKYVAMHRPSSSIGTLAASAFNKAIDERCRPTAEEESSTINPRALTRP
jgi:hypothetical protein